MNLAALQPSDRVQGDGDVQSARSLILLDPFLTIDPTKGELDALLRHGFRLASSSPRQRRMKDRDRALLEAAICTALANLALAFLREVEPPSVGMSFKASNRTRTRYDRAGFRSLPRVLGLLAKAGLITIAKSGTRGKASTVTASPALHGTLQGIRFTPDHFTTAGGQETIWLSRSTGRDYVASERHRELIDYTETEETTRYRQEVTKLNDMLARADLRMEPDGGPLVVTSLRHVRRHFNLSQDTPEGTERFDLGGRLFGGWWSHLPKGRRHLIRINGEPVADLDFASMFLRLAFLHAGERPPEGDLYSAIPGLSERRWREGVKTVVLAMLFRMTPLTRLPRDAKGLLPGGISGKQARGAILEAFPALAPIFETGIGMGLMFQESQTLIAAMLDLAGRGHACLPMHDGLMVAGSNADAAMRALQDAAERTVGFRLPVMLKARYG